VGSWLRRAPLLAVLPGLLVFALARLPSLIEPRWYTDEAGYASTAEALLHGRRLYSGIWTNKPPLQILLVAIPVAIDQRSELLLHLLSLACGAAAMAAVVTVAIRLLSPLRAGIAVAVAGLLLGTPILDAELSLPESLLVAPASWAGAVLLLRLFSGDGPGEGVRWAVVCGMFMAAAIAIQQTAAADALALALVLVLSPRATARQRIAYAATVAGLTAAWLVVVVVLAGPGTVAYALGGFYVHYSTAVLPGRSSSALPAGGAALAAHLAVVGAATLLISVGALLLRRSSNPAWAVATWSGATLLVPALAQQPFPHFLTPCVVPGALLLAMLPVDRLTTASPAVHRLGAAAIAAGLVVALALARSTGLDWISAENPLDHTDPSTLGWYYGDAAGIALGLRSHSDWDSSFDGRTASDTAAAAWIEGHGLAGHSTVVWSSDAWVYLLADLPVLLPTAPIYNDEVLLGMNGPVADRVSALAPDLVVTAGDSVTLYPEITPVLQRGYREVAQTGANTVWVRDDIRL
jgi:hypothetical protein